MYCSCGDPSVRSFRNTEHVSSSSSASLANVEAKPITLLGNFSESHRFEDFDSCFISLLAECDGIESADSVFDRDRCVFPCAGWRRARMPDQLQLQAVRLGDRK